MFYVICFSPFTYKFYTFLGAVVGRLARQESRVYGKEFSQYKIILLARYHTIFNVRSVYARAEDL